MESAYPNWSVWLFSSDPRQRLRIKRSLLAANVFGACALTAIYAAWMGFMDAHDVRLLTAMQTSDANKIATPEGWTPGCDVIVPPPKTPAAIAARKGEGYAMKDWYFSTKSL